MERFVLDKKVKKLLELSPIPYAIYQFIDQRVVTILLSQGFTELFGLQNEDAVYLMDHDMYRDAYPDDVARIAEAAVAFAREETPYDVVYRSRRLPSDDYFLVHAYGRHVYTDKGRLAVVWYVDEGDYDEAKVGRLREGGSAEALPAGSGDNADLQITHSRRIEEENLRHEQAYDHLTGLPAMPYFMQIAGAFQKELQQKGSEPVMLFFDVNGMKAYNVRYGFEQGDALLRSLARILSDTYSNENCGRFGLDHFVVYTEEDAELELTLQSVFRQIAQINGGRSLPVRVGIYLNRMEDVPAQVACDRAKVACDQDRGRYASSFTYFDKSMLDYLTDRSYILENLDEALREGWIQTYYQPIIRTATGLVCSEEALARWVDPGGKTIQPNDFIPILEDARQLYKLDIHMVNQVLHDLREKQNKGVPVVPVSVNLSWYDFQQCDMAEEISAQMDLLNVPHNMLNIEITETAIGKDPDYMRVQIDRFHEKGFAVWMDDFGSGYSSLDTLQYYDFDLIKMNRDFMKNFETLKKSRIIMTELIHMATRLGIDTLAEGVETSEQLQFLQEIGCNKIQGFYYSRPNPLQEVVRRYQTGVGIGMEDQRQADLYEKESRSHFAYKRMEMQTFVDNLNYPASILAVTKTEDGYCGEIHIVCANERYKAAMGPGYYDGMLYHELVPKDPKFEDFAFRSAILGEKMQTYVRTEALHAWTDMTLVPLAGSDESLGFCMFMFELTQEAEVSRMSSVSLETCQLLVSYCIRLLGAEDFKEGVKAVMGDLAQTAGAAKCRILLRDDRLQEVEDFCEAINEEAADGYHTRAELPYELVRTWDGMIGVSNCVIIKNEHDMELMAQRNPAWAASLREHDVRSLFLVPLRYDKKTIGYLYLANFNTDTIVQLKELIELVAYILGTELAVYQMMQYLEWLSIMDVLTGLKNRNSMIRRMQDLTSGTCGPMGIINMDLNELKTVNDTMGHEAGDDLLRYAAGIMKEVFGEGDLYRTGGDEFIALVVDQPKEYYEQKLVQLQQAQQADSRFNIAIGSYWSEGGVQDVEEALERADRSMYIDKKEYYEHHPEKDRRRSSR